jgi:hypothetical protein
MPARCDGRSGAGASLIGRLARVVSIITNPDPSEDDGLHASSDLGHDPPGRRDVDLGIDLRGA